MTSYTTQEVKACTTCNQTKPVTEFYRSKDSYTNQCKSCRRVSQKKYIERNPEKVKVYLSRFSPTEGV